jgi:hypothetical protein
MKRLRPHCEKSYGVASPGPVSPSRAPRRATNLHKPRKAVAQQRQAAQQHAAPPIYEVVNPQDVAAIHRLPKVTCPVLAADGSNFAEGSPFEALCMVNRCWNMLTRQPASSTDDESMSVTCSSSACPRGPAAECPEGDDR